MLADEKTELGRLMHDLRCANPAEMHYNVLRERLAYFKEITEGIEEMPNAFEDAMQRIVKEATQKAREESLKEGKADGLKKGRQEVARSMVADGSIPLSKIAKFSGLTLGEVESIKKSIQP